MGISTNTTIGSGLQFDLAVEQAGMKITVKAGVIRLDDADVSLAEDEDVTIPTRGNDTDVIAYLVKDKASGELHVLVDEIEKDGVDEPYSFTKQGPYHQLADLYQVRVPAGATTLDAETIRVKRVVVPDPEFTHKKGS